MRDGSLVAGKTAVSLLRRLSKTDTGSVLHRPLSKNNWAWRCSALPCPVAIPGSKGEITEHEETIRANQQAGRYSRFPL